MYFGDNLISWGSKKQSIIPLSSTEAKYRCLALVATELVWLQSFLTDLHISLTHSPVLWCDNLSAVHLSANPIILHSKTKHVELDIYFVRDLDLNKKIQIQHFPATAQVADIFAKSLFAASFLKLCFKLNVRDPTSTGLRGC